MKHDQKPFREKIDERFRKIVEKYPAMRLPAFLGLGALLLLYTLASGWKRYALASFLLANILVGSSFAYPVFSEWDGFVSGEVVAEVVPAQESTIELAQDDEFDAAEVFVDEEEAEEGLDNYDSYSLADILAEREETGVGEQADEIEDGLEAQPGEEEAAEVVEELEAAADSPVFSADDWRLLLINKQRPIPDDYEPVLGTIKGYMKCDERIIDDLLLMMQGAQDDGVNLVIISPYRDLEYQERLFNRKIDSFMRRGYSYLEAYKQSAHTVTVPSTSEHEIGLALDITSRNYRNLSVDFAETEAGRWLAEHSYEYGFIVRYPLGKEYITSIQFEPWHFRYVGKEAAKVIYEKELTLEEFWDKYVQ
ncbi:MAG: M15 family metallopeptidase [Lachnospiraceae bacterium]|jgi:D-alanyl-D-alanine carboxypeptidase|nr:M15 family metallopeptidase [Lachnospiraceae bacterium]